MCTSKRYIINRYTGKSVLVKCGHCKSCLQEKANSRASRIRATKKDGYVPLMVLLSYDNNSVPYVLCKDLKHYFTDKTGELKKFQTLPVYRDVSVRRNRKGKSYIFVKDKHFHRHVLTYLDVSDVSFNDSRFPHPLKRKSWAVGISYYTDVQNFIKNLRQWLKRRGVTYDLVFYICSEYGETYFRPHFHLLLWCKYEDVELFKRGRDECWLFDNPNVLPRRCEIARDAASYVASYVNCDSSLPSIFKDKCFKQKHSYSRHFGMDLRSFSINSIMLATSRNDLQYNREVVVDKVPSVIRLPYPKYVINRYFPRFKGYSRLTASEIRECVACPSAVSKYARRCEYTIVDVHKIKTSLYNARVRFAFATGRGNYLSLIDEQLAEDYAFWYERTWQCFANTKLKLFYENKEHIPPGYQYDNINQLGERGFINVTLQDIMEESQVPYIADPNKFPYNVQTTLHLEELYDKKVKSKKVNACEMQANGLFV